MGTYDQQTRELLASALPTAGSSSLPPSLPDGSVRMYAVSFDLDTEALKLAYGKPSWSNAYAEIRTAMEGKGFAWQQGSVYFGPATMTAVGCVLAVQQISAALPWFKASVRDIRMLRIEELNDLKPAL